MDAEVAAGNKGTTMATTTFTTRNDARQHVRELCGDWLYSLAQIDGCMQEDRQVAEDTLTDWLWTHQAEYAEMDREDQTARLSSLFADTQASIEREIKIRSDAAQDA